MANKKSFKSLSLQEKIAIWNEMSEDLKRWKSNVGLDTLKLCYTVEEGVAEEAEANAPNVLHVDDVSLYRRKGKHFKDVYEITLGNSTFGLLKFNLKAANEEVNNDIAKVKWAWIEVANPVFYSPEGLTYLRYVTDMLGLRFRNVTRCDIRIDTSKRDPWRQLKRKIRSEVLRMFLNGKEVADMNEYLPEIPFIHRGSRRRYTKMSGYIQDAKAKKNSAAGTTVKCYNKMDELEESKKQYVLNAYPKPPKRLHRVEVRTGNEQFKRFWAGLWNADNFEPFDENLFSNRGFLYAMFQHFTDKVLYFIDENGEHIGITNILR